MLNGTQKGITVVIAARNDDYGENFLGRLRTCLKAYDNAARHARCAVKLLIVEWNPPRGTPPLNTVLPTLSTIQVSVATVPSRVCACVNGNPFDEWRAKNVGIRLADTSHCLLTNADIVPQDTLFTELEELGLALACFYSAVRVDIPFASVNVGDEGTRVSRDDVIAVHRKHATQRRGRHGVLSVLPAMVRRSLCWLPPYRLHTNAAGDFLLAPTSVLRDACGYPESGRRSYSDGILPYILANRKIAQVCIPESQCIYHLDHVRPRNPGRLRYHLNRWRVWCMRLRRSNPVEHWGLGQMLEQVTTVVQS